MEYNSRHNSHLLVNDKKLSILLWIIFSISSFYLIINYLQRDESGCGIANKNYSRLLSVVNNSNENDANIPPNADNRILENNIYILFLRDLGGKVFEGSYEIKNGYELFEGKSGKIRINFYSSNNQGYSIFTIDYTILNGNYKEKWLSIVQKFAINQFPKSSEIHGQLTENKIILTGSDKQYAKITSNNLLKSMNKTSSLVDNFNINVSMPYYHGIIGNLAIKNLSIDIAYKVNIKQNDSINFERKLDNLGFILTTIAFINLYYTIVTLRDCLIHKINPKSVS